MKLRWTVIPQIAALAVQMLLPAWPDAAFVSKWGAFIHTVVSFLQAAGAILAHYADGTGGGSPLSVIPNIKLTVQPRRTLDGGGSVVNHPDHEFLDEPGSRTTQPRQAPPQA